MIRNLALHAAGLAMGTANTIRHNRQGYVTPRPFDAKDVQRTLDHAFEVVDRLERDGSVDWTGKRVLECGPGPDLTTGVIMVVRGAESYCAVDRFDNRAQASGSLYEALGQRLDAAIQRERLGFVQATFPLLSEVTGPFELFMSNATLEHVEDVPTLFESLRRLSAPGGRMVHHVDARTHMRWIKDLDPLNILRFSDFTYDHLLQFPGAPNRLRASDYRRAAESSGWRVTGVVPAITAEAGYLRRLRLARRFRDADDLELLAFTLVAERGA